MVALIFAVLIPTTLAWFTDSATANINSTINFGTVKIGVGEKSGLKNVTSESRALERILPGDTLELSVELFNDGNVDIYSKAEIITDPKLLAAGEIVEDGQVNMDDVIRLLRFVAKAIPNLKYL